MPSRPKFFAYLAVVFAIITLSFPLQIAALYNHHFSDISLILNKISILNFFVICSLLINIPLLLKVSPLLKYSIPTTALFVVWNNYIVGSFAQNFSLTVTTLSSLAFCSMLIPLLKQKNLALLRNPNLRWWQRPTRLQSSLQVLLLPHVGKKIITDLFDVSETGAFIPLDLNENSKNFKVGDLTSLNLRLTEFKSLKCEAEVVRISRANGNYPDGMGIKFLGVHPKMKSELKDYITENLI